jgi:hypothetical protein
MQPLGTKVGQVGTNLVPKSLPPGTKVTTHWYQSLSLVPKLAEVVPNVWVGAKVLKNKKSSTFVVTN